MNNTPKCDEGGLLTEGGLDYYWRKGLSKERDHQDAAREVAKAQQALDNQKHQKEIGEILDYITEFFVEPCGNFYMTDENRKIVYELWQGVKKQVLKAKHRGKDE